MKRATCILLAIPIAILLLCMIGVGISAFSNRDLPTASRETGRLSADEQARVAEFLHLKQTLGDSVWPGWGKANIPTLVYNEKNAFLVDYANPPAGWDLVANDSVIGSYYGQPSAKPQAFAVKVGDRWVGSMATMEWMRIKLMNEVRGDLPPFLQPIFPYRLALGLMYSDWHIVTSGHESFHAYQATMAPDRFNAALASYRAEKDYPFQDTAFQANWQQEINLLVKGADQTDGDVRATAAQFLKLRANRRQSANLSREQIEYEQQIEWLEGLAKYMELGMWRAGGSPSYTPVPAITTVADFKRYSGYKERWKQELDQMPGLASKEGDTRFYYSGMAQARMLDQIMPDWKTRILSENVSLEELLQQAISSTVFQQSIDGQ